MLEGEEDMYFNWKFTYPAPLDKPAKGYDLNIREWFHNEVSERTGGRLNIKIYPGGQLSNIREAPQVVGSGIVEIGMVPLGEMFPDLFPYTSISAIPFFGVGDMAIDAKLQQAAWNHPLVEANFKKLGLKQAYATGPVPLYLGLGKKVGKIETMADFAGLQFRSQGYDATWAKAMGMTPVNIKAYEVYMGFEKGIIDLTAQGWAEFERFKLWEVCDYGLDFPVKVSAGGGQAVMNLNKWNSLPQYIKDIWVQVEKDATAYSIPYKQVAIESGRNAMIANGMEIYKLSPEVNALAREAGVAAWEEFVRNAEMSANGTNVREFVGEMIDLRNELTGEPFTVYDPFK
jgi:TRAP-type C4-dicarboxylate transport system substrate-binding protein